MVITWLPVRGYEGRYEVSDSGLVYNVKTGQELEGWPRNGRPSVDLMRDGRRKTHFRATLVLEAFVGLCPPGLECCHGDGDVNNSALSNLRWDTHSANMLDQVLHGTHHNASKTHCIRNHEFTPENTMGSSGARACRECYYARKRARDGILLLTADEFRSAAIGLERLHTVHNDGGADWWSLASRLRVIAHGVEAGIEAPQPQPK